MSFRGALNGINSKMMVNMEDSHQKRLRKLWNKIVTFLEFTINPEDYANGVIALSITPLFIIGETEPEQIWIYRGTNKICFETLYTNLFEIDNVEVMESSVSTNKIMKIIGKNPVFAGRYNTLFVVRISNETYLTMEFGRGKPKSILITKEYKSDISREECDKLIRDWKYPSIDAATGLPPATEEQMKAFHIVSDPKQ